MDPDRLDQLERDDPMLVADMAEAVNVWREEEERRWARLIAALAARAGP